MQKLAPTEPCCNEKQARGWLEAVGELAVMGDEDARRWLPHVINHWLSAVRREAGRD
jgi:hypothetical protein